MELLTRTGYRVEEKGVQRMAALVPRLRLHLIRFHGEPASNAKLRAGFAEDPRRDRKAGGDREDSYAPGPARAGAAARSGAAVAARSRSLIREDHGHGSAAEPRSVLAQRPPGGARTLPVQAYPGRSRACIVTARGVRLAAHPCLFEARGIRYRLSGKVM